MTLYTVRAYKWPSFRATLDTRAGNAAAAIAKTRKRLEDEAYEDCGDFGPIRYLCASPSPNAACRDNDEFAELHLGEIMPGSDALLESPPAECIDVALMHLRAARLALRHAGSIRAAAYVSRCLKSAEGAKRHAERIGSEARGSADDAR